MISKVLFMDGYGLYVWSSFAFTLLSFFLLFVVTKIQYARERKKFIVKFGNLKSEKASFAKSQSINNQILSNTSGF
tara:strand:+ start:240 stop:467 length:228 start_codon:yes stop_codon:yes gene_type:complete